MAINTEDNDMATIDYSDTGRTIVHHSPDGETYIVEWEGDTCTGSTIIGVAGPIYYGDLWGEDQVGVITDNVRQRVRDWETRDQLDDVDWMNAEEAAGNVGYPYGGSLA